MQTYRPTPARCDLCKEDFLLAPGTLMFDAAVPRRGSWGCLCIDCFQKLGCALGTGRGQQYSRQADGTFLQTHGGGRT